MLLEDQPRDRASLVKQERQLLGELQVHDEPYRHYPHGRALAHLVGYMNQITSGEYVVRGIDQIDEENRTLFAMAAYNAGPGRPPQWVAMCGDPRTDSTDPLDFIECIPFSETRNYVMRVMENMTVYRAKLNGGTAPITLSSDLRRGGYGYRAASVVARGMRKSPAALRPFTRKLDKEKAAGSGRKNRTSRLLQPRRRNSLNWSMGP